MIHPDRFKDQVMVVTGQTDPSTVFFVRQAPR